MPRTGANAACVERAPAPAAFDFDFALNSTVSLQTQSAAGSESRESSANATASRLSTALWICLLTAFAAILRLYELGTRSLWLDEAASSMLARSDWNTFLSALVHRQSNMALYYVLLRGWIHLGHNEFSLRLLSVIFGAAAIPILYRLVNAIRGSKAGTKTAWLASFVLSIHVFHLQYSQEARGYSLAVLLTLASCYCFLRLLNASPKGLPLSYTLASILMVYSHVFGILILAAQWACALLLPNPASVKKTIGIAAGVISLCISPLAFSLLFVSDRSQLSWINRTSLASLWEVFLALGGSSGAPLALLFAALLLFSLRSHFREAQPPRENTAYIFLWVWLLLPILIAGIISLRWPLLQARYLIVSLPPFLILAADGLARIQSRAIFIGAMITAAGLSLAGVNSYYKARTDRDHTDNWRAATTYCLSQAQPGDAVLFPYSAEEIPFREYQHWLGQETPNFTLIPQKTELELLSTAGTWTSPALASDAALHNRRVWVITALQPNQHSAEVEAALRLHLNEESRRSFGFVTAHLFAQSQSH